MSGDSEKSKWQTMDEASEHEHDAAEVAEDSVLEEDMDETTLALKEAKDQALRLQAEMQNLRARSEREIQNAHKYATGKLLKDLLPTVDSMMRGLEQKDADATALREGLNLTLDMLEKVLEKNGVETISPEVGDAFDPVHHEAMSMVPSEEAESNTIIQVLQKGYQLNGRVVRAAMVIVAQ